MLNTFTFLFLVLYFWLLGLYFTLKGDNSPGALYIGGLTHELAAFFEFTLVPVVYFIVYGTRTVVRMK
jgi:hypothetical protein